MAEEKKQKFAAAEAKGGPGGGGPHARGGFQKPKDTKKTIKRLLTYITTRKSLLVLIGVFLIISAVAFIIIGNYGYIFSIGRLSVSMVSMFENILPLTSVIFSVILLGRSLAPLQLAGGAIVIIATSILALKE